MRILALFVVTVLVLVGVWELEYPSGDPKSIEYALWKIGLPTLNVDRATGTMIGDADRRELVIGKTKAQLRTRFGLLLSLDQTSQYNRDCYLGALKDTYKEVLFIRTSPWMVAFDGETAIDLVLIKGC